MPPFPVLIRQISSAMVGGLTDPDTTASRKLLVIGGFVASGVRFATATSIGGLGPRPEQPLRLWELEACPHSRAVREALSTLDLDAEVHPCPEGGTRFRPALNGSTVPHLEDPNAGVTLTGSMLIVRHLYERYGAGAPPRLLNLTPVRLATGVAIRYLTGQRGASSRPSRMPEKPLELWSFESSPYCRFVRSLLSELELPYVLHNVAKDSPRREAFIARTGKMQVPWLFDPNTGTELFESRRIEQYLESTYAL